MCVLFNKYPESVGHIGVLPNQATIVQIVHDLQFEHDLGSKRTAEALGHKCANGEVYSQQVPFGFRAVLGAIVADDAQQAVVARTVSLTAAKNGPIAIARSLNAEGVASPGGSTWYASSVASVLKTSQRLKAHNARRVIAA